MGWVCRGPASCQNRSNSVGSYPRRGCQWPSCTDETVQPRWPDQNGRGCRANCTDATALRSASQGMWISCAGVLIISTIVAAAPSCCASTMKCVSRSRYADWYPKMFDGESSGRQRPAALVAVVVLVLAAGALLIYLVLSVPGQEAPVDTTSPVVTLR